MTSTVFSSSTSTSASSSSTAQPQPTCGFAGFDNGIGTAAFAYYSDAASSTYAGCNDLCNANTACLSFFISTVASSPACALYDHVVEGNVVSSPGSTYTYFNRGGVCASVSTPTLTSTVASTTSASPIPEPTCGLVGVENTGVDIGYYPNTAPFSACNDLCNSNPSCLSLGYDSNATTCILYSHSVEGNVTANPVSTYSYFNRGSLCPQAATTSSAPNATSTAPATPSFTAGIQYVSHAPTFDLQGTSLLTATSAQPTT